MSTKTYSYSYTHPNGTTYIYKKVHKVTGKKPGRPRKTEEQKIAELQKKIGNIKGSNEIPLLVLDVPQTN